MFYSGLLPPRLELFLMEQWCTSWTLAATAYHDSIFKNWNISVGLVSLLQSNFTRLFAITHEILASSMQYFITVTMISFYHFFLHSSINITTSVSLWCQQPAISSMQNYDFFCSAPFSTCVLGRTLIKKFAFSSVGFV